MYNMYFTITSRCNQCCTCCPYTEEDVQAPDMDVRQIEEAVRKKCGIAGTAEEGDAIYTEAVE
jgi:hypothetical protein